jgi:Arc/MetJ family transcription regulator
MARLEIDIDDELVRRVQAAYGLPTAQQAVDVALRRLLAEPMTESEALGMRGAGWPGHLDELRRGAGHPTDEPAARADSSGQSLQGYRAGRLIAQTSRPDLDVVLDGVRVRMRATGSSVSTEDVLAARDAGRS